MDDKKLNEIRTRKEEIRNLLESDDKELNLEELRSEIETLNKEEKEIEERMKIATQINNDEIVSKKIETNIKTNEVNKKMENKLESIEYRNAFMNYVCKGEQMPEEFRDVSLAAENQAVIPVPILNKIVEKIENYGNLLPLVTRVSYPAGLAIPTSQLAAVATWTNEQTLSTTGIPVNKKVTGSVVFGAFPLVSALGISFVAQQQVLSAFESALVNNISTALGKALEKALIDGTGVAQPKGVLTYANEAGTKSLALSASLKYKDLINMKKNIPEQYREGAVFLMNDATFWELQSITDNSGAPVARVNYGIDGTPVYAIMGTRVITSDFMADYDSATSGDTVIVAVQPDKIILNSAYNIDLIQYVDHPTRNKVYQACGMFDSRMADTNGLLKITKG
jgi:HK97 family phage major capsid protein